jgi:hypothetical protein
MLIRFSLLTLLSLLTTSCIPISSAIVREEVDVEDVQMSEEEDELLGNTGAWSEERAAILDEAISRATQLTSDTVFLTIVRESASANEIVWTARNLSHLPDSAHASPTDWILSRFSQAGHFRVPEIRVGDWTFSRTLRKTTRAKTVACPLRKQLCTTFRTRFHPRIVSSNALNSLANTVIHERIHAFGQVHVSQKRSQNYCEAPSVIGDIGESLLEFREQNRPIQPRQRLCPPLEARLRARGIVR